MLDMGFEPALHRIAQYVPRSRQTLFFSATWPREVQAIANRFAINRPVKLFVGKVSVSGGAWPVKGPGLLVR